MKLSKFPLVEIFLRYASFIKWFLPDALRQYKLPVALVLLASVLGVGFQALTYAAVIYYANLIASGDHFFADFYFAQIDLSPRESLTLLLVVSVMALSSLGLSALSIYFARTGNIKIGRKYNEYCIERFLDLVARAKQPLLVTTESKFVDERYLMRLMIGDARVCGRVQRVMLDMIVPIVTLFFSFGILLYQNARLTLIILICMSGYVVVQAHVSRNGAKSTKRFESYAPLVAKLLREMLRSAAASYLPKKVPDKFKTYRVVSTRAGALRSQLDAFEGRVRATEQSRLVSGLFTALMVGLLLFILGREIITSGLGWGALLVYLVALRFAMTSLQLVFGQLTTVNRFYPQIQRYSRFVCSYPEELPIHLPNISWPIALEIESSPDTEGESKLMISQGGKVALLYPFNVHKYNYSHCIKQIADAADLPVEQILENTQYLSSSHSLVGYKLSYIFSLNEKNTFSHINFPESYYAELKDKVNRLDAPITATQWESMSKRLQCFLLLKTVRNCEENLILIDSELIRGTDKEDVQHVDVLRNRLLLIAFDNRSSDQIKDIAPDTVLISNGDKIVAGGSVDWYLRRKDVVEALISQPSQEGLVKSLGDWGEEDYELG